MNAEKMQNPLQYPGPNPEENQEKLEILYRSEDLVAVNKPFGLLVHRSEIDRRETRFALQLVRDQLGQWVYPVHRLDRPTSGVLLLGLNPEAARCLGEAFAAGAVEKTYLAVVRGVTPEEGIIDYPLTEELDRCSDRLARSDKAPQPAVTAYRRLATVELPCPVGRYATSRYSLIEARPHTGRKHQLRRHFKHLFHPLIGDTKHGEGRHNRFFRDTYDCRRLLLAAVEITLPHPVTSQPLRISAPLEESFAAVVEKLGWKEAVPERWWRKSS
jgi:tRNA pseudouridine65 synthase